MGADHGCRQVASWTPRHAQLRLSQRPSNRTHAFRRSKVTVVQVDRLDRPVPLHGTDRNEPSELVSHNVFVIEISVAIRSVRSQGRQPKRLIAPAETTDPNPTTRNAASHAAGLEVPPVACKPRPTAKEPRDPERPVASRSRCVSTLLCATSQLAACSRAEPPLMPHRHRARARRVHSD